MTETSNKSRRQSVDIGMVDDLLFEDEQQQAPDEPFYIEADLYDSGDYVRLLVVPCDTRYVLVLNDEHLCTLQLTCDEPVCWEQEDGTLDDEVVERLGAAIRAVSQ
ncbi:hypothetical protein [Arcticibacter sp. MXS-1]|uniref:hypothetical protein n=1 Tax=Arcticibacter sp. MXS-1 TaxID=3341726 RepID=UPI0035A8C6C1